MNIKLQYFEWLATEDPCGECSSKHCKAKSCFYTRMEYEKYLKGGDK